MRRITKDIAREAATRMACKYYDSGIKKQGKIISAYAEELVNKYIPYPVRAVLKEYPKYFTTSTTVTVTAYYEVRGRMEAAPYLSAKVSEIPYPGRTIVVKMEEYTKLKGFYLRLKKLEEDKEKMITNVSATLYGLRTDVKVEQELPGAMEYISFPPVVALPADYKNLEEIRNMIKGLKRKDNE